MKRSIFLVSGLLLSFGLTAACGLRTEADAARTTTTVDACTVALAPGSERSAADRTIARLQQEVRAAENPVKGSAFHIPAEPLTGWQFLFGALRAPRTATRWAQRVQHPRSEPLGGPKGALERLGYAFVARARVNNDPGDYRLAETAAACLDKKYPGESAALLLQGHVLHQLHRFSEAERIARLLVARRTFVLDYGLLGDALMEQGRLADAANAYQKMIDLKPFYQSYTRAAHVRWLKGDVDGAIEAMRLATQSASPRDPESSAWAWTRLAAYELQRGRQEAALKAAETALRHQPDYAAALLAQGRIFLAMSRPSDAIAALRHAARLNPLPEYQWVLADALRQHGLGAEADAVEKELTAHGRVTDPRTLALYLATRRTDVATAVSLVEEELRARADVFTLDARAWTLASSGRMSEAVPAITRAVAEGTQDGRLFLHAGIIHAAAGHTREGKRWLKKAQRLRSMLLPSELEQLDEHLDQTRFN